MINHDIKKSPCLSLETKQGENRKDLLNNNITNLINSINDIGKKANIKFILHSDNGDIVMKANGRQGQTLYWLCKTQNKGITALEMGTWAIRLAVYIYALRHRFNINITTIKEPQSDGLGTYGRYILQDKITITEINV